MTSNMDGLVMSHVRLESDGINLLVNGHPRARIYELRRVFYPYKPSRCVETSATLARTESWMIAQIRHYGLQVPPHPTRADLISTIRDAIERNPFLAPPRRLFELQKRIQARADPNKPGISLIQRETKLREMFSERPSHSEQAALDMDYFVRHHFLGPNARYSSVHRTGLICLENFRHSAYAAMICQKYRLSYKVVGFGETTTIFLGGDHAMVHNYALHRDIQRREEMRSLRAARWLNYQQMHQIVLDSSSNSPKDSEAWVPGLYGIQCDPLAEEFESTDMLLEIRSDVFGTCRIGYLRFGAFQAAFIIAHDEQELQKHGDILESLVIPRTHFDDSSEDSDSEGPDSGEFELDEANNSEGGDFPEDGAGIDDSELLHSMDDSDVEEDFSDDDDHECDNLDEDERKEDESNSDGSMDSDPEKRDEGGCHEGEEKSEDDESERGEHEVEAESKGEGEVKTEGGEEATEDPASPDRLVLLDTSGRESRGVDEAPSDGTWQGYIQLRSCERHGIGRLEMRHGVGCGLFLCDRETASMLGSIKLSHGAQVELIGKRIGATPDH
ncbi:hypothetical protein BDZ85DRAFT_249013 [Elsinoe ampelina]|uniref:Uncharacterized protein n=1 Tax=Elsinoe ampelina TaxID=302913 RepID=A0A6A6GFT6_9PEZI|nr:hypothetical protein BDZ85DRAFT_249013 [Elsinoe ampelina]